jgi:hypothetical protein
MKVKLKIEKDGAPLHEHVYDISDSESFGKACAQAWLQLREQRLARATSIGALYEELDYQLLDELIGAQFTLLKSK